MKRSRRRRSAEVLVLPGVERRDLVGPEIPSAEIFAAAVNAGVRNVVVVGLNRCGELYVAAEGGDIDRDVGMLMRAVTFLAGSRVGNSGGS